MSFPNDFIIENDNTTDEALPFINPDGTYNRHYNPTDDTFGTYTFPELVVTANHPSNTHRELAKYEQAGREGYLLMNRARRKAYPFMAAVAGPIVAGAALPAMGTFLPWLGSTATTVGTKILTNPYINALGTSAGLADAGLKIYTGNIGHNLMDDAFTTLELLPAVNSVVRHTDDVVDAIKGVPKFIKDISQQGHILKAVTSAKEQFPIFIRTKNSYTRGIGRGTEGVVDLVNSGVVRGNPRGTEITAHLFAKNWRHNRLHFKDIMKDTGIPNIELKFFARNLNQKEFEAIKQAASKYRIKDFELPILLRPISTDPLIAYNSYDDYVKAIQQQISEVELMPGKIKSGAIKVNTSLNKLGNRLPSGTPIEERFGPNSDYVGDGHPLTYWYADGRNPFRKGYDYAGSDWGVRVLNADSQTPFMHTYHLHPSFFYTPRLDSPNVQIFRRLPFGLGLRVPKKLVINKFKNSSLADDAIKTASSKAAASSGKNLITPHALMSEYGKLKEFSAKFFEHPVVTASYKHNLELAKRMGIILPDKDAAAVVRQPVNIKIGKLDDDEIANVALEYFGDPNAIITMDNNYHPIDELRQGFVHENLHRGWYGKPLRPAKVDRLYYDEIFKPEYSFWNLKVKKLLNPKYYNDGYLSDVLSGEAATNFIDLGRDLGLKLGLKYPGYDAVKKMLDSYKGYKRFMIPRLNTSKAGMRHVWDAMTGNYFAIPAAGILYTGLNK